MTFPTLFDTLAANLLADQPRPENPHHRTLLDTFIELQHLDQQLMDLANPDLPTNDSAVDTLENLTDLLAERLTAGRELARLLSVACCCAKTPAENETEDDDGFLFCPGERQQSAGIVRACLEVFAAVGDPDAMSSADLVDCLRDLPGVAEGRWRYAELTQIRLAQLLAPYEVSTRDVTLPDGRRRKSYRRGALLAALPDLSC